MQKKNLGQFFTTNYVYILQGLEVPEGTLNVIEPFTGNGDLLNFVKDKEVHVECYDIDPKHNYIIKRDTILNPPEYKGKFVFTNPPYLARNKASDKTAYDKYNTNDLYKCFIEELITNCADGGILIIPLNFWSSIRDADISLRKRFLEKYKIILLNIFEEQVFEDTTYTVCSFQFEKKNATTHSDFKAVIYPHKTFINVKLDTNNNFLIGGEIYLLPVSPNFKIGRLTKYNMEEKNTNLVVKCIDDNAKKQINMFFCSDDEIYIDQTDNSSARTYATLIITPPLDEEKQKKLAKDFNDFLAKHRVKYASLFLTNYRESKDIARKRISFALVYRIIGHLLM